MSLPNELVQKLACPQCHGALGYSEEEKFITKLFQLLSEDGFQRLDWHEDQLSPIDDHFEIIGGEFIE